MRHHERDHLTSSHSANENTVNAGKKTVTPADVFKALEDTEFSFLRAPLEAEFASMLFFPSPLKANRKTTFQDEPPGLTQAS